MQNSCQNLWIPLLEKFYGSKLVCTTHYICWSEKLWKTQRCCKWIIQLWKVKKKVFNLGMCRKKFWSCVISANIQQKFTIFNHSLRTSMRSSVYAKLVTINYKIYDEISLRLFLFWRRGKKKSPNQAWKSSS